MLEKLQANETAGAKGTRAFAPRTDGASESFMAKSTPTTGDISYKFAHAEDPV
jgi:hypothetical protein